MSNLRCTKTECTQTDLQQKLNFTFRIATYLKTFIQRIPNPKQIAILVI